MKHFSIVVLMFLVISISACSPGKLFVPTLSTTPTSTLTATSTITPTKTPEPTSTPTPIPTGGGGRFIMRIAQHLVPKEFNSQEPYSWFSASSDGSNLKLLDWQIWSISPDGKRALTYTSDERVSLTNLDGTGEIQLDDSLDYYIDNNDQTAVWVPNGNIALLAFEQKEDIPERIISLYIVSPDGKQTKWEKPSQIMKKTVELLFISPDGEKLYWINDNCKQMDCTKPEEYYVTSFDDSEQKRILETVSRSQMMYISPSGQYISYVDVSGKDPIMGCFIYNVADNTEIRIMGSTSVGLAFCYGTNRWSPTEDLLLNFNGNIENGIPIWSATESKMMNIGTVSDINAGWCYSKSWSPDGKYVFLSVCLEEESYEMSLQKWGENITLPITESLGQRLIDISNGNVKEYPDAGFCNFVISPGSSWVLLFACTNEKNLVVYPSQLLNLDTKEMVPVFQGFVSNNPITQYYNEPNHIGDWLVYWIS